MTLEGFGVHTSMWTMHWDRAGAERTIPAAAAYKMDFIDFLFVLFLVYFIVCLVIICIADADLTLTFYDKFGRKIGETITAILWSF